MKVGNNKPNPRLSGLGDTGTTDFASIFNAPVMSYTSAGTVSTAPDVGGDLITTQEYAALPQSPSATPTANSLSSTLTSWLTGITATASALKAAVSPTPAATTAAAPKPSLLSGVSMPMLAVGGLLIFSLLKKKRR